MAMFDEAETQVAVPEAAMDLDARARFVLRTYFHVFGAGSQRQRGVAAAWGCPSTGIGIALMDALPSAGLSAPARAGAG